MQDSTFKMLFEKNPKNSMNNATQELDLSFSRGLAGGERTGVTMAMVMASRTQASTFSTTSFVIG